MKSLNLLEEYLQDLLLRIELFWFILSGTVIAMSFERNRLKQKYFKQIFWQSRKKNGNRSWMGASARQKPEGRQYEQEY
jgi:hypothetical protein